MLEVRTKVLVNSVRKLYRREAWKNIKRVLGKTHVADIAALLEELDREERLRIFQVLDDSDKKAEILSYLEGRNQKDLLLSLEKREANELVSKMDSDDAADLLGNLPKERSQEILDSLTDEAAAEEVEDLLRYPEDSAGGLMSTNFLAINQNSTIAQAIQQIQSKEDENLITFYLYVIDDNEHLVGVLSLKDLILSKPHELLKDLMITDIISADVETDQEVVAEIVERYDFLSLPVINEDHRLVGIITVDDVIDVIRAEATDDFMSMGRTSEDEEKHFFKSMVSRIPWLSFSFFGGGLCFFLILWLGYSFHDNSLLTVAAMIPMLLSLGATSGGQAATVTVGYITSGRIDRTYVVHFFSEFFRSIIYGLIFGGVFYLFSFYGMQFPQEPALTLSLVVAAQLVVSIVIGTIVPLLLEKTGFDPMKGSVPIFAVIADITSILILFSVAM